MTEEKEILTLAIKGLYAEREKIDHKISELESRLRTRRARTAEVSEPNISGKKKKRRFSAATRKLLSQRLKAHWAKKRKEK